jgi:hypothetical protein
MTIVSATGLVAAIHALLQGFEQYLAIPFPVEEHYAKLKALHQEVERQALPLRLRTPGLKPEELDVPKLEEAGLLLYQDVRQTDELVSRLGLGTPIYQMERRPLSSQWTAFRSRLEKIREVAEVIERITPLDLPAIVLRITQLKQTIEKPPTIRDTAGEPYPPWYVIRQAGQHLLELLCPNGVVCDKNRDIDNADLSRPIKIALRDLWKLLVSEHQLPPNLWYRNAAESPDEWVVLLEGTLKTLGSWASDEENSIQPVGKMWELRYGGERGQYGDKCIRWLCTILCHPNRSLTVAEVIGDPEGRLAGDAQLFGERTCDTEGIQNIKRHLEEIEDICTTTGGSPSLDEKKAELLRQLEAANQQIKSPLRAAHHNIASQIRTFRRKLTKRMPELSAHLKAALK